MRAAPLRWLPVSVALHGAALAALFLVVRDVAQPALFVDLTLSPPTITAPSLPPAAGGAERPVTAPRAAARGAAPAPRATPSPSPPAAPAAVATPPPALVPPPAPPAAAPAPPPAIALEVPAAPAAASQPPARESDARAPSPARESVAAGARGGIAAVAAGVAGGSAAAGGGTSVGGGVGDAGVGPGRGGGAGEGLVALAPPGDGGGAYAAYLALLRRRVQESLRYPVAARRRGLSGTVHLEIALEPSGAISAVALARSSSHALLDDAALEAVRGLGRVPFPPDVRPRALRVRLPVVFELR